MARIPLQRTNTLPYHINARVNNREEFHLPLNICWEFMGLECLFLNIVYGVEFHALVLMPNHFHMILTVPEHDLGKVMNVFISTITRMSNLKSRRSGHLFGGPYHRSVIDSSRYFGHTLKYVYRNPVRAKLCTHVEDYPYSTLHGLLGFSHLPFPIHFTRTGMELSLPAIESFDLLDWLNTPFPKEAEELIRQGLRKRAFDTIMNRKTRRPLDLLNQLL